MKYPAGILIKFWFSDASARCCIECLLRFVTTNEYIRDPQKPEEFYVTQLHVRKRFAELLLPAKEQRYHTKWIGVSLN